MAQSTLDLLISLLPDGPYNKELPAGGQWPNYALVLASAAVVLDSLDDRVDLLLAEVFPGTSVETLARWEAVFDLHPQTGATTAARQAAVLAAWQLKPSMSVPYVEQVVSTLLGISATITEFVQPIFGTPFTGEAVFGDLWVDEGIFRFLVNVTLGDVTAVGLTVSDFQAAQALIDLVKPAHTQGIFTVGGAIFDEPLTPFDWGAFQ